MQPGKKRKLLIYGTSGWGKSHLLAAFTCFQRRNGVPVVYFPDCKQLLDSNPLNYIRRALISACISESEVLANVLECTEESHYEIICQTLSKETIFVADQWNALELEGVDPLKSEKNKWRAFLDSIAQNHVLVLGASANNYTQARIFTKNLDLTPLILQGGFDDVRLVYLDSQTFRLR